MSSPEHDSPNCTPVQNDRKSVVCQSLCVWVANWIGHEILHQNLTSIPCFQSALNFFMNGILIFWGLLGVSIYNCVVLRLCILRRK
jgi:hypothetical protein